MQKIKVGVIGGSGYTGLELLRILLSHPGVEIAAVASRSSAGKPISAVHPSLDGLLDLECVPLESDLSALNVIFIAVPHTESMALVQKLAESARFQSGALKVIDLGTDFRLPSAEFQKRYGTPHTAEALLQRAVYGTPELSPSRVREANLVANPGCFAHCITLALAPLVQQKLLAPEQAQIRVSAITGSTGSGATPTTRTHHPERNESLVAYEVFTHRHVPEIELALQRASANEYTPRIDLVPLSGPFSRGILATCFVKLQSSEVKLAAAYARFAQEHRFVRLREYSPRLNQVRGSNFCDLAVHQHGSDAVVLAAIDNLVKGAAGNAVQCMNLMCGFDETLGLLSAPLGP